MNIKDVVMDILKLAVHAPSGDNSQPWKFKIDGSTITLFNVPEGDGTLYNYKQRGSFISHGAVIENICIIANKLGFQSDVKVFQGGGDMVAQVTIVEGTSEPQPLYDYIEKRATNRKPYEKRNLSSLHTESLKNAAGHAGHDLRFVEKRDELEQLAGVLSLNERLLMENRELHDFLFGMIRWTEREEAKRPGLYVRTMEFPAPVRLLLRYVVKHWAAVKVLNKIGLSKAIPKQSAEVYKASSAFGAVILKDTESSSYVLAGRALQRTWLEATRLGLSMQPVTALPYLAGRIDTGEVRSLSPEHISLIQEAYAHIEKAFGLAGGEKIAMLFRVGYDGEPSGRSVKLPPVIVS